MKQRLKRELDAARPLPTEAAVRVAQKLRLKANYHSNAIEGNTLTLGETRSLILHGLTARGKPLRHHLDIRGHAAAAKALEETVAGAGEINDAFAVSVRLWGYWVFTVGVCVSSSTA